MANLGGGSCLSNARVSGVVTMSFKSCSAEVFVNSRRRPSFVTTALCHSAFLVASLELAALGVMSLLLASYSLLDMARDTLPNPKSNGRLLGLF